MPAVLVPRPRIEEFLDGVPSSPANLVVAPAGSGKTVAAAAWTERVAHDRHPLAVSWTRGDEADVIAGQLRAMRTPGTEGPDVLVVDDAHLLDDATTQLLADVLTSEPESVRLLLLGRQEPDAVPIAASLSGAARLLRMEGLRFDAEDAEKLVRVHHPDASDDDVTAVLEQADGWAAALVLGARALAASPNSADARSALAATRRPVLDYLLHEVFEGLRPDAVQVLLSTCQQEQVSEEEAVLLSGIPDAAAILEQGVSTGLLVTGYREADGMSRWRYHPLLLDLLRRRTAPTGPDWPVVVEAHHRAAEAYIDRREAARAMEHAQLTGDLDTQLCAFREFGTELLTRGHEALLRRALGSVPLDVRTRQPELLVLQALLLRIEGQVDAAKAATDRAVAVETRSLGGPLGHDAAAQLAVLTLWQARIGWREAEPALARAQRVLGCHHDAEVSTHDLGGASPLAAAWLFLELSYFQTWLGERGLAAIHVQDATQYADQVDQPALTQAVLAQRAMLEMMNGAYQTALATADAAHDIVVPGELGSEPAARIHLVRGWALLEELRLDEAAQAVAQLDAIRHGVLGPLLRASERLLRACLLIANGEAAAASRLLDSRGDAPEHLPRHLAGPDHQVRLLVGIVMGDFTSVETQARSGRTKDGSFGARFAEAVLSGLRGDHQRAVTILTQLLPTTADAPTTVGLATAVARVAFLQRIGTATAVQSARDLVPDLLSRAEPQRLLGELAFGSLLSRGFVDLIAENADSADPHPFAHDAAKGLRAVAATYRAPGRVPDLAPPEEPREVLTARELEVLEQLALGGGNADLARALFVSENTVKTHLASIYRKLDVDRRADALRVARDQGLL